MGISGSCPTCGKGWGGTPPGHYGYVVTECIECQMNKSKAWEKIGDMYATRIAEDKRN